ncbi:MAG: Gx transporter family protein [Tissierellia bacterium]|nr:Gx transporter family protein [Tissierellia bacterium]
MRQSKLRKDLFIAMLTALGVAIGFIESFIPLPIPLPGARLGLSNVVILTTIVYFGAKEGILVALLKSFLLMLVSGQVSSFFYSFTGALFASLAMSLVWKHMKEISLIGVSLVGSACHNLGQVLVGALIIHNLRLFYYLPFLWILGIFTGAFVGYSSQLLVGHLEKILVKGDDL